MLLVGVFCQADVPRHPPAWWPPQAKGWWASTIAGDGRDRYKPRTGHGTGAAQEGIPPGCAWPFTERGVWVHVGDWVHVAHGFHSSFGFGFQGVGQGAPNYVGIVCTCKMRGLWRRSEVGVLRRY